MIAKLLNRSQWMLLVVTVLLIGCIVTFTAVSAAMAGGVSTDKGPEGPAQTAYAPANGPGPVIIVISGQKGPHDYQPYAAELSRLGYYTVLIDGNDILNPEHTGDVNLMKVIDRAQSSPSAVKGKTAVIGFSLGGGGALYFAANMSDAVSMVVAYYPYTRSWSNNIDSLVKRFQVPVLVLAGAKDRYKDCCLIETAQTIEVAAKESGAQFKLVVYPQAEHRFNLKTDSQGKPAHNYRKDDDRDAWGRTLEMLKLYQPLM